MPLSVVIPAHDEALVIGQCLDALARQTLRDPVDVVVVADDCSDATAQLARAHAPALQALGYALTVIELAPPPGGASCKRLALDAGDSAARWPHRVYLDADVVVSPGALAAIDEAFTDGVLLCAPRIIAVGRGPFSRAYGRLWSQAPYVRETVLGAGLLAVHADGRSRWERFPEIMADDKFMRLQFTPHEQRVLPDASFTVYLPPGLRELVVVRARWTRASLQLAAEMPELVPAADRWRLPRAAWHLVRRPGNWPDLPLVGIVYALAAARAAVLHARRETTWERAAGARAARA